MCILLHVNINAQDALIAEYNCETGCIDLKINGGFEPYEVEWQKFEGGQGYSAVSGWPKFDLSGNNGDEDLCNISKGRYKVIVTDALCGTVELKMPVNPCNCLTITLIDKENASICNGTEPDLPGSTSNESCDGKIDIDVESNSPYTISWSGPNWYSSNSEDISNLCTGTYKVEVTVQGCTREMTFDICCCNVGLGLPWEPDFPFPLCTDDGYTPPITINGEIDSPNGAITISIDGGTAPSFSWTGPNGYTSTLQNISNLELGTYCLRAFDGCSEDEECFEIVDCSLVDIQIDGNVTETCPNVCFGSISTSVSGGKAPYRFSWDDGSTSQNTSQTLCSGQHCVTVTDKSGCYSVECFNVGVKSEDFTDSTVPCGRQFKCNGFDTRFVANSGRFVTFTGCRSRNVHCAQTNGIISSSNLPWASTAIFRDCTIKGLCPNFLPFENWQTISFGSTSTQAIWMDLPCSQCPGGIGRFCMEVRICRINGFSFIMQVNGQLPLDDCPGGPGLMPIEHEDKLFVDFDVSIGAVIHQLRKLELVDSTESFIIPEHLSLETCALEYNDFINDGNDKDPIIYNEILIKDEYEEISKEKILCTIENLDLKEEINKIEVRNNDNYGQAGKEIDIYPNPTNGKLNIDFSNPALKVKIEVYNLTGEKVLYYTDLYLPQRIVELDLLNVPKGIYILRVEYDSKIINQKLIIQ